MCTASIRQVVRESGCGSLSSLLRCACLLVGVLFQPIVGECADPELVSSCLAVEAVDLSREMFSELDDDERALLVEYRDAVEQLQSFYENIVLIGRAEMFDGSVDPGAPHESEAISSILLKFQSREGEYFRLDREFLDLNQNPTIEIGIIRPEEQYLLGKDTQTNKHFLKGHTKNVETSHWTLRHNSYHDAPYTDDSQLLTGHVILTRPAWVSKDDVVRVRSVEVENNEDGEQVVRVHVTRESSGGYGDTEYVFLRDRSWALASQNKTVFVHATEESPEGFAQRSETKVEYSGSEDGIPLLKSYERTQASAQVADLEALTPDGHTVFTVLEIVPGSAASEVFDVDAMFGDGLRFPLEPVQSRWWLVALNGVALFLLGAFLLRRKPRPKSPRTECSVNIEFGGRNILNERQRSGLRQSTSQTSSLTRH